MWAGNHCSFRGCVMVVGTAQSILAAVEVMALPPYRCMAVFESLRMTVQPGSVAARAMAISSACAVVLAGKLAAAVMVPVLAVTDTAAYQLGLSWYAATSTYRAPASVAYCLLRVLARARLRAS